MMNKLFPHKGYRKIAVVLIEAVILLAMFFAACAVLGKILDIAFLVVGL